MLKVDLNKVALCPKCGSKLNYNFFGNYVCPKASCFYSCEYAEFTYHLNKAIALGKASKHGKIGIKINTNTGECVIFEDKLLSSSKYGPYKLNELTINIRSKVETIYSSTKGVGSMIAGGILFGAIGAIAGSMTSPAKTKQHNKESFSIIITTNDTEYTGISVNTTDYNIVHDFVTTIENIKKRLIPSKKNDEHSTIIEESVKSLTSDEVFEKLKRLKVLLDENIISKVEYETLKEKYIKML